MIVQTVCVNTTELSEPIQKLQIVMSQFQTVLYSVKCKTHLKKNVAYNIYWQLLVWKIGDVCLKVTTITKLHANV